MTSVKTDLSTVLGIFTALALVAGAIAMGGSIKSFINYPSILIVFGGTFAATTACFSLPEILRAQGLIFKTIFSSSESPSEAARQVLELSESARKNGLLALQNHATSGTLSPFLEKGVSMVVDGMEPDAAEGILRQDTYSMLDRHATGISILRKSAEISPAMGLIGTLIGLVQMLGRLEDPSSIGPAMAVALLTTLYGAMLAYMVFSPLASKLERNSREEALLNTIYTKGILAIARKENPRRLEMVLNTILPPGQRVTYFD